jgi:hypothetical protein
LIAGTVCGPAALRRFYGTGTPPQQTGKYLRETRGEGSNMPIYEQAGPWVIEFAMHIPLAIIGFIIMWKAGVFKREGGHAVLGMTIYICLFFPIVEGLWHFVFPQLFPAYTGIL